MYGIATAAAAAKKASVNPHLSICLKLYRKILENISQIIGCVCILKYKSNISMCVVRCGIRNSWPNGKQIELSKFFKLDLVYGVLQNGLLLMPSYPSITEILYYFSVSLYMCVCVRAHLSDGKMNRMYPLSSIINYYIKYLIFFAIFFFQR